MKAKVAAAEFEFLVREHHAAVYRTALRVVRDDALALDATQQTFLRVLEGKLRLENATDASRILRCAAAREALMLLRSDASRRRREQEHAMERPEGFEEERAEQLDALGALRRSVAALPDELRHALVLRFQEGLTFAEVGGALAISEPSAHDRVQRALDKLRDKLSRLGMSAVIPSVPEMLAREEAIDVPPALQSRLLALPKGAATKLVSLPMLATAAIGVVLATAIVAATLESRSRESEASLFGLGSVGGAASSSATPNAEPPADFRREAFHGAGQTLDVELSNSAQSGKKDELAKGVLEGRVVDAVGAPIEGAQVFARSVEREGKFAVFAAQMDTGRDGAFRFALDVAVAGGQDYYVSAITPSARRTLDTVRIRPGETAPFQRIELDPDPTDRPGEFALDVAVRTDTGAALAGAYVYVEQLRKYGNGVFFAEPESGGTTDAAGRVHFEGKRLGSKVLRVDARRLGFAPHRERLELADSGHRDVAVALERGLSISGTIVNDHDEPMTGARLGGGTVALYATASDRNEWLQAEFDAPGHFAIPSLARGPHEVHFRLEGWSQFHLANVEAGRSDLAIELKRRTDTADRGTHDAEIHAECIDAATGAPVAFEFLDVKLDEIAADSPALADRDFAPVYLDPYIAQVAQELVGDETEVPPAPPPNVYIADGLEPGRYLLHATIAGYAPMFVGPIELREREIASGIQLRLARGANVSGVVLDAQRHPVANAFVFLVGGGELSRKRVADVDDEIRSTASRGRRSVHGSMTDAQGRFQFDHVPTGGDLRFAVAHADYEPSVSNALELREGAAKSLELAFTRARAR